MQIHFFKSLLSAYCLLFLQFYFGLHLMVAQNDMRNLPSAAGGGGTDGTVAMTQDLLGRVFMAAQLGTSREGRILHQNKIISNFPTILGRQINQGFLNSYEFEKPLSGDRFGGMSKYLTPYSKRLLPLNLDTQEIKLSSATWFQFKGIDAMKPTSSAGLSYDTNSSNQKTAATSDSIILTSGLNFNFNYGARPGSSTMASLLYQPTNLMPIAGSGVNEFEQRIMFQIGREFHRNAIALNNRTTITAAPLRELPGRTRTILNNTSLRGFYDVSPLSSLLYELTHSIQKRSETGNNALQSITEDEFRLNYRYGLSPKLSALSSFNARTTQLGNQKTFSDAYTIGLNYNPKAKLTLSITGGYQFRHSPNQATATSQLYRFSCIYAAGPKTLIETILNKEVRPSFADDGIFVTEDAMSFIVTQSIALRWQARFLADYILRQDDNPRSFLGLKQNDIGGILNLSYFMNETDTVIFSFSSFMLEDIRSEIITRRSSATISWSHAF